MLDVCENRDLERTEVKVGAWQVYKQRAAIFAVTGRSSENLFLKRMLRQSTRPRDLVSSVECRICKHCAIDDEETKVMNFNQTLKSKDSRRPVLYLGVVHFPSVCGVQYGTEEFLFLGRLLFDSPVVKCAPRWQEWQRARNNARSRGRLQCDSP